MGIGNARRKLAWAVGIGAVLAGAAAPMASADTLRDPLGLVGIGTNGSNTGTGAGYHSTIAVSQGGCAKGTVAVAVGDPGRDCAARTNWSPVPGTGDAEGAVAVGLLGADSNGTYVAVSDTGNADVTCQWYILDGCVTSVAVSGGGPASARDAAVSGTGRASGSSQYIHNLASASGTGDADDAVVAVSVLGDADGDLLAVSGTGHAHSSGGVSVSGTGTADND